SRGASACNWGGDGVVQTVKCPTSRDASTVCNLICQTPAPCSKKYGCINNVSKCSAQGGPGRLVSINGCTMSDGPPTAAAPASLSDYSFASASTSTATLTVSGQTATTAIPGSIYLNASTSPPIAGAMAEIAWLRLQPADVFVGGSVGSFVRNMKLAHPKRLFGTFTDSTHFAIAPGAAEFILTFQTEPIEGEISSPVSVRAAN